MTLLGGAVDLRGRVPWSSNGTFLVEVGDNGSRSLAIYKPLRGERPLWDYPPGLFRREVAAYVVSEVLGWGLVPETIARDGPLGPGSMQRFVVANLQEHYFTLLERPEHHEALKAICAFDLLVNNGDRKSGHCLLDEQAKIWAIDHGLCFHAHPKLRTVIWDFAGQPLPAALVADLARFSAAPPELGHLLDPQEQAALVERAAALVRRPVFPRALSSRAYPWPLV